jgi:ribosomal protein S18 acetylase RimI-like enzyme
MADVKIRAATEKDKAAVLDFCERGSEEGDYLAATWEAWREDADGALLIAEESGRPAGVAHLRMLSAQEAWLEGLRVDPDDQGRGIGGLLVQAVVDAARTRGATVVRLFTSAENGPAQRLFERTDFEQVALFMPYEAAAEEGAAAAAVAAGATLRAARPDERDALWSFLLASNFVPLNGGLLIEGWVARALTPAILHERLTANAVRVLEAWGTIQGMAIITRRAESRRGPTLLVEYIDGMAEGIGRLALALREEAVHANLQRVVVSVPDVLILRDAMDGAGYAQGGHAEGGIWCYARRLRTQ